MTKRPIMQDALSVIGCMTEAPAMQERIYHVGVISDTHGLIRPEALKALHGSDLILHAGDIGSPLVMRSLQCIAPVVAVRGNTDREQWMHCLPATETREIEGFMFHILHDLSCFDLDPLVAGMHVIISGHSHRPFISTNNGVLYLNPGSAGPRRFDLPITVARIVIAQGGLHPETIYLA